MPSWSGPAPREEGSGILQISPAAAEPLGAVEVQAELPDAWTPPQCWARSRSSKWLVTLGHRGHFWVAFLDIDLGHTPEKRPGS